MDCSQVGLNFFMKKRIINWGILSTAKIGWEHVIPAIIKSKNSQVIALSLIHI